LANLELATCRDDVDEADYATDLGVVDLGKGDLLVLAVHPRYRREETIYNRAACSTQVHLSPTTIWWKATLGLKVV